VDQEQEEERPEGRRRFRVGPPYPEQGQDRRPADQVAEGDELLGGEVAVRELGAEEQGHQGGDVERPQNERLLQGVEALARQVAEDERIPGAPDEELQEHHHAELQTDGGHRGLSRSL
jgi:hypothetical protein